jgi:hypothetical protein
MAIHSATPKIATPFANLAVVWGELTVEQEKQF